MIVRVVAALALAVPLTAAAGDALVIARPQQTEPFRFFGNRTVAVPLLIHAPQPDGLALRAEFVQLTANLSVPIGNGIDVPLGSSAEIDLPVPLPAVKRETGFELHIRSHRDGDPDWRPAGRIALRVYPSDLLAPVRAWAKSHSLRVEDDHGSLKQFLLQEGIRIAGAWKTPGVTLCAGERTLRNRARSLPQGEETIVLFTERQAELPHLLVERSGRGAAVTVEMRLLDRLATDPLAQRIFLKVFRLLHQERPPTKGDFQ